MAPCKRGAKLTCNEKLVQNHVTSVEKDLVCLCFYILYVRKFPTEDRFDLRPLFLTISIRIGLLIFFIIVGLYNWAINV